MPPKDVHHLLAVGWTSSGDVDDGGGFPEVCRAHDRRRYHGKLFHILAAEVVKAVYRAARNAERLSWSYLDGRSLNRPCQDAFDPIDDFLVSVIAMGGRGQLLPGRNSKLEYGCAAARIFAGNEEADTERTYRDCFF
jgi:hypothetical protein